MMWQRFGAVTFQYGYERMVFMRSRGGLFWQSLFLTLLVLVPLSAGVLYLSGQRQHQAEVELAAAAGRGDVGVDAGATNTHRLLLAIQTETPEFLLLRIDAPARTITFCGVPGTTLVDAPEGQTTLEDCYLAAGPARASQLLADTVGLAPDAYFAATPDTYAQLIGTETTARFDTASVMDYEQRVALGYGEENAPELTPAVTEEFLTTLREGMDARESASLRAAVWCVFLRQNPARLTLLVEAAREQSSRTLTSMTAQDLLRAEQTLEYLSAQTAATVEYTVFSGSETPAGYALDEEGREEAARLLG